MNTPPEQRGLFGFDLPTTWFEPEAIRPELGGPRSYKLFLAIFPDPEVLEFLSPATMDLCVQSGLYAKKVVEPRRLHITLHTIDDYIDKIPQEDVDAALAMCNSVVCPTFPIVFDRALSFQSNNAYVLRCNGQSDAAIARLRRPLTSALKKAGLRNTSPSETPHMTMQYRCHHGIAEHPISPICWTATRFALILSHVGLKHHQWIAQWPLKLQR